MSEYYLLALDQASTTGFSIFDKQGNLLEYGKFTVEGDTFDKYVAMRSKIKELMDKYQPKVCLVEDIQQQANVQTFKTLAGLQAIVVATVLEYDCDVEAVYSSSWRSTVQLGGRTRTILKQNAQRMVEENFNVRTNQDTSEAILLGWSYFKRKTNELNFE